MPSLAEIGKSIGEGLADMGTYSARAAAQANSVSAASQAAQGQFNQASANMANAQNQQSMMGQWNYNSAMMSNANDWTANMWQKTADWNESMWERQANFNAEQAELNRQWQERMANTQYQRAVQDMEKAGLNPILAVQGGGVGTSAPSGSVASVGGAQMSSAQSATTTGGLLGANSASEGNFTGQMEYLAGTMGLISMLISGISSATSAAGSLGDIGEGLMGTIGEWINRTLNYGKKEVLDWATDGDWSKTQAENMKAKHQQPPIVIDTRGVKKK